MGESDLRDGEKQKQRMATRLDDQCDDDLRTAKWVGLKGGERRGDQPRAGERQRRRKDTVLMCRGGGWGASQCEGGPYGLPVPVLFSNISAW